MYRDLESRESSRSRQAQMKKLRNESYSLWMDMLYRLSLANYVCEPLAMCVCEPLAMYS